ncbi:hypothetical protein ELAC_2015 [Estrella lausannensis]|uniref:Uncharacterized protein n=1 Tax=Estrella lausannensis TaxID=483423 RepID=A0A0H5DRU1_9BACT|nr:hypothetical protein ELAC_2015 [Estrella lausannensis]
MYTLACVINGFESTMIMKEKSSTQAWRMCRKSDRSISALKQPGAAPISSEDFANPLLKKSAERFSQIHL